MTAINKVLSTTLCLKCLVIGETILLSLLLLTRLRVSYVHTSATTKPNPERFGPLYSALEYESPDTTFERLVKENPYWITFCKPGHSNSILSDCAESKLTNYVRILLSNGADFKKAIDYEERTTNVEAEDLLRQMRTEGMYQ
jgi:hypothetical protein